MIWCDELREGDLIELRIPSGDIRVCEIRDQPWKLTDGRWCFTVRGIVGGYTTDMIRRVITIGGRKL